ncbi:regulator of chromosome condensation 1/beta-lactamase-inhibitor protein II [Schizophyllum commune]
MTGITDLPIEIFTDYILSFLPVSDILHLAQTCRFFALICADDTFWKIRVKEDFNFTGAGTARTSGWKFIYRGLYNPRGAQDAEKSCGRLGLPKFPKVVVGHVPFPTPLRIPGARIVHLEAGGMSFHAIDSEGTLYVWGALDGSTGTLRSDGFSEPGKRAETPLRLRLPAATRTISCGRLHSSTLDANGHIWTFLSWGRPFRLTSPLLDPAHTVAVQVECGWHFSSILTKTGDVFVWFTNDGDMKSRITDNMREMDSAGDKKAHPTEDGYIPCVTWDLELDPIRLPPLPALPDLPDTGDADNLDEATRLIQIAGMDCHLVGVTNKGHVLKFGSLSGEAHVAQGRWEYLPKFSELSHIREHPTFSGPSASVKAPDTLKITHVSAHFLNFIAYSTGGSSIVLIGDTDTTADLDPQITPELQHRAVISVVLGDYHKGALTADGKLLTWGAYSKGALGLGDPGKLPAGAPGGFADERTRGVAVDRGRGEPPAVEVPTEVRFDWGLKKRRERFCFQATAAGWHTGALVIDLTEEEEEDELEYEDPAQNRILHHPPHHWNADGGDLPHLGPLRGLGGFRIGYAGRGRGLNAGGGRGLNRGRGGPP